MTMDEISELVKAVKETALGHNESKGNFFFE
jgi:hypothetical protein